MKNEFGYSDFIWDFYAKDTVEKTRKEPEVCTHKNFHSSDAAAISKCKSFSKVADCKDYKSCPTVVCPTGKVCVGSRVYTYTKLVGKSVSGNDLKEFTGVENEQSCLELCDIEMSCLAVDYMNDKKCKLKYKSTNEGLALVASTKSLTFGEKIKASKCIFQCQWNEKYGVLHYKGGCTENNMIGTVHSDKIYTPETCN